MKENEMLLKNRRSDSNLFRQKKSDCDCTLKTLKTFLFHQFELFFHLQIRKTSLFNSSITQCFKSQEKCLIFLLFVPLFEFSRKKYTGANVFIFGAKIQSL